MSAELESFIDESLRQSSAKGYPAPIFRRMRGDWGTKGAIERLVASGDIQTGFLRLKELGLIEWSIEAAVLKFPDEFSKGIREAAAFRLEQADHA